ncbi:MAG: protein-tyrosine phosphatase family protein [Anaerolineales bacterium]
MLPVPIPESYWVVADQFLAGAYPASRDERLARQRLSALLEANIAEFINLTQPNEMPAYEPLLNELAPLYNLTARHTRIPFRDGGIPDPEDMQKILDLIDAAIQSGRKVYAHCWGGIGRTGVTVGCYLVRHGETPARAVARVNALYHTRPANPFYPRSPESDEQIQFILDWREG